MRTRDQSVIWEKQNVTGTQINYPRNSALKVGEEYLVVVESDNRKSSQLDEVDKEKLPTFQLLSPEAIQQINTEIKTLEQQQLSPEAKALEIADIYRREELFYEASTILESLANQNSNIIAVYQNLGDIYRYVGLNLLAESRYQQAIYLANSSQDSDRLAMAQTGLAVVKEMLGKRNEAIQLLIKAKAEFEALRDSERVAELEERLKILGAS